MVRSTLTKRHYLNITAISRLRIDSLGFRSISSSMLWPRSVNRLTSTYPELSFRWGSPRKHLWKPAWRWAASTRAKGMMDPLSLPTNRSCRTRKILLQLPNPRRSRLGARGILISAPTSTQGAALSFLSSFEVLSGFLQSTTNLLHQNSQEMMRICTRALRTTKAEKVQ